MTARATTLDTTPTEHRENTVLAELARHLRGTITDELTEGGSPARLVTVTLPDGSVSVVKLLVDLPGAVDGHDLESFRVKIRQIEKVRNDIPALASSYTELADEFHGDDWSAYTMPFYPNEDVAAVLRRDHNPRGFFTRLGPILDDLINLGYRHDHRPVPQRHIAHVHAERLQRRFRLLRRHLPPALTEASHLVVNGRRCRNPLDLARRLSADPALTEPIEPATLHYPVHGDLNTRNILCTEHGYRIIDPRGTLEHWDPSYDLSKILFSLTVWDAGLRKGFDIDGGSGPEWSVSIRNGNYPGYHAAAGELHDFLRNRPSFREMTAGDRGWSSRYLLGYAFHLLAEAACRLSDLKKRADETASSQLSPIELATGHYLYGVLFLDDAVSQLEASGMIEHDETLSLLPRYTT